MTLQIYTWVCRRLECPGKYFCIGTSHTNSYLQQQASQMPQRNGKLWVSIYVLLLPCTRWMDLWTHDAPMVETSQELILSMLNSRLSPWRKEPPLTMQFTKQHRLYKTVTNAISKLAALRGDKGLGADFGHLATTILQTIEDIMQADNEAVDFQTYSYLLWQVQRLLSLSITNVNLATHTKGQWWSEVMVRPII